MTKISYCEVSLDARLPQMHFRDTSLDALGALANDDDGSPWLRVIARDKEAAHSVRFTTCAYEMVRNISQPKSTFRRSLADITLLYATRRAAIWTSRRKLHTHFFVYDAIRSRLEPIAQMTENDAWRSALATLEQARDYHLQHARWIIACALPASITPDELLDVLHNHLASPEVPAPAIAAPRPTSPMDAQRKLRERFLSMGWPTSADVAARLGSDAVNHAQVAADLRKRGQLLGAWSHRGGVFVHPPFQFDAEHRLREDVATLLATLRDLTLNSNGEFVDKGGWRRVFWLYGPRAELEDRAPADVFAEDPARVLHLAQADLAAIHRSALLDSEG